MLLKASFRSALFNLALLLSDTGRPLEAVPFLKQLVHYHTDHIKGLILLGDIYINSLKDLNAAEEVSPFPWFYFHQVTCNLSKKLYEVYRSPALSGLVYFL